MMVARAASVLTMIYQRGSPALRASSDGFCTGSCLRDIRENASSDQIAQTGCAAMAYARRLQPGEGIESCWLARSLRATTARYFTPPAAFHLAAAIGVQEKEQLG